MVVFAGQGDARRSMALLWRSASSEGTRTGPGPKPGLSVDAIVDTAIEVADADGMTGLSMRAVGERLGRTAMALYTYVPNKSELLDLMYDQALAELPTDYAGHRGWRAAITAWAGDQWAFYLRHPWVLQVSQARPVLGPNEFVALETVVGIVYRTELTGPVVRRVVGTLSQFVRGMAQTAAESRQAPTATGKSDQDWWLARSGLLEEIAPNRAECFPMVTRMGNEDVFDDADDGTPYLAQRARETFDTGLAVLLDGIEAAIGRARRS